MVKKRAVALALSLAVVLASIPGELSVNTQRAEAATTWRSALYPENWTPGYTNSNGQFLSDFSYAGYEMGEKEIPTSMAGLFADVTKYGADATGTNNSTSAIQAAIDAVEAAGGGTVYLPAGTYKVKPSSNENSCALRISGSNILFKGDGVGKTFIRCYAENMRYCQVINVSPTSGTWDSANDGNYYYLSKDIPETPTTTINLKSVGDLKAGDWVIIRSDRTADWINEHGMSGFWSASVNSTTMGTTFYRKITSVDSVNKTITIDIPTRYWMKTRDNARVYKVEPKQSNVGLMDFSIGNKANSGTSGWGEEDYKTSGTASYNVNNAFLIKFSLNVNCFAKNISTYKAGNSSEIHMSSNGLDINKTRNLTVENCDFSYPQYEGGGGNGYGMNICGQETLIKNCSSTSARHSFSFKYAYASGNVIYHYTSTDPKYGSDFHMYLSMSNLIDNEELNGDFCETNVRPYGGTVGNYHGYTSTQTVFWNTKGNYYKSGSSYIIDSRQYKYGYIIGTSGNAYNVKTTPTVMSSSYGTVDTAPEDYKEGIGAGATLYPQSLYLDQLSKRLARENKDGVTTETTTETTTQAEKTTYQSTSESASNIAEVFGVVISSETPNELTVVWGRNMEKENEGMRYNVYIDGKKVLEKVECASYTLKNIEAGERTVRVTSVLGSEESEGYVGKINVEDAAATNVEINGLQISTGTKGLRVLYSVGENWSDIESIGLIYGLADYCNESEMVSDSSNAYVKQYESSSAGMLDTSVSSMSQAKTYAMTMKFIKNTDFYNANMYVRAYARHSDGTYTYSNIKNFTVYSLADYLYQNKKMLTAQQHEYLYNEILYFVNKEYAVKEY